jgi:hypothetical protein
MTTSIHDHGRNARRGARRQRRHRSARGSRASQRPRRARSRTTAGQLPRPRLPANLEGAAAGRRAGAALPGAEAHAHARDRRRQAPRQAVAHDTALPSGAPPRRSRAARLQRRADQLSVADPSYSRWSEGVVFIAFVIDAYSHTSSADSRPRTCARPSSLDALWIALGQRHPGADVALVHQRDGGSAQYTSMDYTPDAHRPRRPGLSRVGRRRLRHSVTDLVLGAVASV